MNIWDKTTIITPEIAQKLLREQCALDAADIKHLGQGFDNTAFLVNHEFVFRFPHRAQSLMLMENEIALLPYLCEQVIFSLPKLTHVGNPTEYYPYPFAGYKIVPGKLLSEFCTPLIDDKIFAQTLGLWLKQMHSLPVLPEHMQTLKGENDWRLDVQHRTKQVHERLEQYRSCFDAHQLDPALLARGMERFKNIDTRIAQQHYVHGDLYSKHILVSERGCPSGLIDWGDAHIGHPALDIGIAFMIFTDTARQAFFDAYGNVDQNWKNIALFRAYFHAILSLPYFVHENDSSAAVWAKAALGNAAQLIEKL